MLIIKPIILAGAIAVAGSLAAITNYYLSKQKPKELTRVDDDTLIRFLKELKSQSFTNFFLVAGIIKNLQNENFGQEQVEVIMEQIMVEIENLFEAKQKIVLGLYQYTREEIEISIEQSTNQVVKKHLQAFERLYSNCLKGIEPEINLTEETRNNFSQKQVVETIQAVLNVSIRLIYETCKQLRLTMGPKFQITLSSPEFVQHIHKVGVLGAKRQILIERGVTKYEPEQDELGEPTSPTQVFSKLSYHYRQKDGEFKTYVDGLEKSYEDLVVKFMKQDIPEEEANKLFKELPDSFGKE